MVKCALLPQDGASVCIQNTGRKEGGREKKGEVEKVDQLIKREIHVC